MILSYSKKIEYNRTIELLKEIFENQGVYFALAFLYDSQYGKDDIKNMMEIIHPNKSLK